MLDELFEDMDGATTITIAEILKGAEAGRMQSVGYLSVIPLLSDYEDDRFASPAQAKVKTSDYGKMVFTNEDGEKILLVPSHAGYVVKQAAQDHAMSQLGLVRKGKSKSFDTAMCIQETQGGYIRNDQHKMLILPFSLREAALSKRDKKAYNKLWPAIRALNKEMGIKGPGHLEYFLRTFQKELDQFVAEFEIVPRQVGAIVLLDGRVVGVERAPSCEYWEEIWEALIRECYGSLAIEYRKKFKDNEPAPRDRVPLPDEVDSLEALRDALDEAERKESELAKERIRELLREPFRRTEEDKMGKIVVETVEHDQFVGQIIQEKGDVLYASLVAKKHWLRRKGKEKSKPFSI